MLKILALSFVLACVSLCAQGAYPEKPIRMILPSAAGAEIRNALAAPAVIERYKQLDTEPDGSGPEAFLALVRGETPKWADVVKKSGAEID